MDAIMGLVGSLLITRWAIEPIKDTTNTLLDGRSDLELIDEIRNILEGEADNRISDLHAWRIGEHSTAGIISLVAHYPQPVQYYRQLLAPDHQLKHVTIEENVCTDTPCLPIASFSS
jgi:Co/Zn/Cd efflux system component